MNISKQEVSFCITLGYLSIDDSERLNWLKLMAPVFIKKFLATDTYYNDDRLAALHSHLELFNLKDTLRYHKKRMKALKGEINTLILSASTVL